MTDLTAHDVLCGAKAYLMRYGWAQGDYGDHGGPRCMLGALKSARGVPIGDNHPATNELGRVIGNYIVCEWNDAPGRTFAEVIDAFDRAIWATAPAPTETPEPSLA